MPESRPINEGAISSAVPLTFALLRGAGKLAPKLLARLGRTTEVGVVDDTNKALFGSRRPEMADITTLIKGLVAAEVFSGFMLQRPGAREAVERKIFGDESVDRVEQFRLLSALGMPVRRDPRLGLDVTYTRERR